KCAPHFMRLVHQTDPESPVLNYETRCPCGTQYCRITPDGKVTPCPYLPEVAGDLRSQRFADVWRASPLFRRLREGRLQGKGGAWARRQGRREVTPALLAEVRRALPIDFSKKRPFFVADS